MAEVKSSEKVGQAGEAVSAGGERGLRKTREGVVVSAKMEKTVVVAVVRQVRHKMYGKFIRKTKRYYAHDEAKGCSVGDIVRIVETRPLSKLKCWRVESVVRKAD
jgi:small subunit ribosomal protein S17